MAKDFTLRATIKGDDQLSPAARSAQQGTEQLAKSLEDLGVSGDDARKVIEEFTKGLEDGAKEALEASKKVEETGGAFSRLGQFLKDRFVITLGDVANIVRSVSRAIGSLVSSAVATEDSMNRLASASIRYGDAAASTVEAANAQSKALQQQSRYSDEAIRSAQALLITLGISKDQLAEATQASVDLAAAFGIELDAAARNVGKTVGGFAGELGEVVPGLKNLSTYALQAGEGVTILANTFSGRAAADAETFSGAIDQLSNAMQELSAAAGSAVTDSATIRKAIQDIRDEAQNPKTVEGLKTIAGGFTLFFATVADLGAQGLGALGRGLDAVAGKLDEFGLNVTTSYMPPVIEARNETDRWFGVLLDAATPFRVVTDAMDGANAAAERSAELARRNARVYADLGSSQAEAAKLADELGIALDNNLNNALAENEQRMLRAIELEKQGVISRGDLLRAEIAYANTKRELLTALNNEEEALDANTKALSDHAERADKAAKANDEFNRSLRETVNAASSAAQATSGIFGRDGNELPAGGKLTQGGTRYDLPGTIDPRTGLPLPGHGSRLVGTSSTGGVSTSPFSGRFLLDTPQYGTIEAFKVGAYGFGPSGAGVTTYGVLPGGRIVQLSER